MKKKLLLLFSLVLCMALLAGCGKAADKKELPEDIVQNVLVNTTQNFEFWQTTDFSDAAEDIFHYGAEDRANFKAWTELKDKIGELKSQKEPSYEVDWNAEIITSKIEAEFANGKIIYSIRFKINGDYESSNPVTINEVQTTSEVMTKALMNTLMGMGTVFCVLIIICLVISSFGLIGKSQAKKQAAKKAEQEAKTPVETSVMAPVEAEEVDDLELVAVITAAIMASMGDEAPAEGLVVRSIRKRNAGSWKNA